MSTATRPAVPVHDFDCAVCGKRIEKPGDGRLVLNTHRAERAWIADARREHQRTIEFERGGLPKVVNLTESLADDGEYPVPWEPRHYGCYGVNGYEIELERITQWWQVADWTAHLLGARTWLRFTTWDTLLRHFAGLGADESPA